MRKPGDEIDSIPWPADAKMTYEKDPFPQFDRETIVEATLMLMRMGEIEMRQP